MKKKKVLEKKEKFFSKKRTMTYLMGSFIILLMIASGLNMWKGDTQETYTYNGLKFVKTEQGFWVAYKGQQKITLIYPPEDLEEIELPVNVGMITYSQKMYISTDDITTNARAMSYFKQKIGITSFKPIACTEDKEGCEELPLKDCDDATQSEGVVVFKKAEETRVTYKANCLVMEGASENLIKAVDKLYFTLSGI